MVKVFVSLCSRCVRSSKHIGAETFVKNNGERILEKWNRGWGIDVWRIGLSEHTKEEEEKMFIIIILHIRLNLYNVCGLSYCYVK